MTKRILVVDDEPNVRLNYRMTLETEGYTVVEADCAAKALEQFSRLHFDLAILDLRMPEMDGLDLLAELRQRGNDTPAAIITAYSDIPHAVRAMKLGAIDFLKKPLTPAQLRGIAEEVIERHESSNVATPSEEIDQALSVEELHQNYLQNAKRLLNLQSFDAARTNLAKALALDPLSVEAFNLTGVLFEMQEDFEAARKHYGHALKLDRAYEPAQQNLQRLLEHADPSTGKAPLAMGDS